MSLHEGVTRANNPSSSQQPSPREQADNHSAGPNNMITLNSDGPTSKSLPDKIEQIPDLRNAAVEEAAAETAQQISTGNDVAEIETVEKSTGDTHFENDEDFYLLS